MKWRIEKRILELRGIEKVLCSFFSFDEFEFVESAIIEWPIGRVVIPISNLFDVALKRIRNIRFITQVSKSRINIAYLESIVQSRSNKKRDKKKSVVSSLEWEREKELKTKKTKFPREIMYRYLELVSLLYNECIVMIVVHLWYRERYKVYWLYNRWVIIKIDTKIKPKSKSKK